MKYLVMECHEGYAVLMDEDAVFVKAADLHYEVGQTVTDPILMEENKSTPVISRRSIIRIATVAACLVLVSFSGYQFYSRNMTDSVVLSTSAAEIEMHIGKDGSVVSLKSKSDIGKEILKKYKEQHKKNQDSAGTANDILAIQIENGYISSGDTIDVFIDADSSSDYDSYKTEIEKEIVKLDLRVSGAETSKPKEDNETPSVNDEIKQNNESVSITPHEETKAEETSNTPAAPPAVGKPENEKKTADDKPVPPAEQHPEHETPAPADPPAVGKPEEHPEAGKPEEAKKPEPPAHPEEDKKPEAPKPAEPDKGHEAVKPEEKKEEDPKPDDSLKPEPPEPHRSPVVSEPDAPELPEIKEEAPKPEEKLPEHEIKEEVPKPEAPHEHLHKEEKHDVI